MRQIVPLKGIYADRTLMPEFPGLAKAESTHDWDAGFPLVYPIRDEGRSLLEDLPRHAEGLRDSGGGSGDVGQPVRDRSRPSGMRCRPTPFASTCREAVYRNLLANLQPEDVGLRFEAVREQALKAAAQGQDFGQLFLGFSLFLVVAALLLMALLFQLGLEQRASEVGILLALGLTPKQVRRLLLVEGSRAGVGGRRALARWAASATPRRCCGALTTVWRSAIGGAELQFHATRGQPVHRPLRQHGRGAC